MIKRIYVEKKKGCDIESDHLCHDIRNNLAIKNLNGVRILNRYDIEGISDEDYDRAKTTIFSEPPVDEIYEETIQFEQDETAFAVEYLPGQYDQRADSAMQCIQIITQQDRPTIAVAKVYVLKGDLTSDDIHKIKNYCINPVDSRQAALDKPDSLTINMKSPDDIKSFDGFIDKSEVEIEAMRNELELAMSTQDLKFCQDYFKNDAKRNPTVTEIRVIDTYWSDHCRHTTFSTTIEEVQIEDGHYSKAIKSAYDMYMNERNHLYVGKNKDVCLMDIAVIAAKSLKKQGKLADLDESEEINACSIVVTVEVDGQNQDWLVMFKNETHNHPTEIEPFGGAATCLGGAIRDPLSGRSYVYQAMRVTGSGDPRTSIKDTLAGKLPQKKITTQAAHGYSSYGNQIGLATGHVSEVYDEGFVAKRMEVGAVIAAAPKANVVRERPTAGDVIILLGGRTGRDGIGGATGSSKEHTEESILTCGAEVQKGNAPTERKLQRLFRNPNVSTLIKRCNDFGAGGVSVAIGELADGLIIDLDKVPKKYEGLDGTELAISESQERMAVVIEKKDIDKFIAYADEENLEATLVAVVTDDRRLKMNWRGNTIVDISRDFLDTNGAKQYTKVKVSEPEKINFFSSTLVSKDKINNDLAAAWLDNLQDLNVCSQKGLVERFDSTIGANTVLMPFGGKNQLTPTEAMAAKIPLLRGDTTTGTLMSYGYNPNISKWSPFHGAAYAVVESVAKIVAAGGTHKDIRLSFQEYFERLGSDATKWGKPFSALLGALLAQMAIGIPAIGGKDSMSGTFKDLTVPPTLISFAVNVVNVNNVISPEFKKAGNQVVYVNLPMDEYELPDFNQLDKLYTHIESLIKAGKIIAAHTVKTGGIAEAVTKMCFGNALGVKFTDHVKAENLFKPYYGSFVLEIVGDADELFKAFNYTVLGMTQQKASIEILGSEIKLAEAIQAWTAPLEKVFPTKADLEDHLDLNIKPYVSTTRQKGKSIAKPTVFIPVFPGTNCEYDSAKVFEKAGAEVNTLVIRNLTNSGLEESIQKTVELISSSQIVMLPGGFSAGDEPDGSGKFIAAFFRNPRIKEEVMKLLNQRDGLMLGICNGFQALIKLGLVPYGEIKDMNDNSPTLTFNNIGRHVSCLVDTKIVSNKSPWLAAVNTGDVHTIAVSHGEGRFIADKATMQTLIANGQIATQYVDAYGNPSYSIEYNPNASMYAIEGITSPDGRVLGKMGHSERIGSNLYKNVPGCKDQKIFESGVNYFK